MPEPLIRGHHVHVVQEHDRALRAVPGEPRDDARAARRRLVALRFDPIAREELGEESAAVRSLPGGLLVSIWG